MFGRALLGVELPSRLSPSVCKVQEGMERVMCFGIRSRYSLETVEDRGEALSKRPPLSGASFCQGYGHHHQKPLFWVPICQVAWPFWTSVAPPVEWV